MGVAKYRFESKSQDRVSRVATRLTFVEFETLAAIL